jgi:hypothetical protein
VIKLTVQSIQPCMSSQCDKIYGPKHSATHVITM